MRIKFKKGDLIRHKAVPYSLAIILSVTKSKINLRTKIIMQWLDIGSYNDEKMWISKATIDSNFILESSILRDIDDI